MVPRVWIMFALLLAAISGFVPAFADEHSAALTACSVFAKNGYSATAIVERNSISLDVANPSGAIVSHLSIPLHHAMPTFTLPAIADRDDRGCGLFINRTGDLVALGVVQSVDRPNVTRLQVDVAELNGAKLVGDFTVEPGEAFMPTSLAGFLEDTTRLVVTGSIPRPWTTAAQQTIHVASLLFDSAGKQLSSVPFVREATASDLFRFYADADHNRLWLFSCGSAQVKPYRVPICPIVDTTLAAKDQARLELDPTGHSHNRDELWMWPDAFAAPSADNILIAETVNGKDTVWRVDMQKRAIERFILPKGHWVKYNAVQQASLSPDGEVLALLINQTELGFPYIVDNYEFKGTDVVVMQLHPFRLLTRIPHKDSTHTTGLSVDHHGDKAFVLVFREGHMERIGISDKSQ